MPLRECRECGREVSSLAPACPHCGVPSPVPKPERYRGEKTYKRMKGWIWFFVIAAGAVFIFRQAENRSPQAQDQAAAVVSQRPASPKTVHEASEELSQCVMPEAQYGRYSSFDGGQSAEKILEQKCIKQWLQLPLGCLN